MQPHGSAKCQRGQRARALVYPHLWRHSGVRVVSLIGDDGRPGSATLSVGLQGIDENHNPLPEMGIITEVPIPYLSARFCDRDFDGDCDLQDLLAESFSEFTSSDIDEWLGDAGTVIINNTIAVEITA